MKREEGVVLKLPNTCDLEISFSRSPRSDVLSTASGARVNRQVWLTERESGQVHSLWRRPEVGSGEFEGSTIQNTLKDVPTLRFGSHPWPRGWLRGLGLNGSVRYYRISKHKERSSGRWSVRLSDCTLRTEMLPEALWCQTRRPEFNNY